MLDLGIAQRLAFELGEALEALHNMGIVHGALRPRNIMVLPDGHVKLMDVELAGLRNCHAVRSESAAEYLSPEQILGAPLNEKTDIYAFGATLYQMLTGVRPFRSATREAILERHRADTPAPVRTRRPGVPVH